MAEPKWKRVEVLGWNEDKKKWLVEGEMQDPRLEIKPGYETRTLYFYEAAVHYEGKSAGFPQFHIELGGSLIGRCWLFFDPPEGTILSVPLVEHNAADVIVDATTIVIPSKEEGIEGGHCYNEAGELVMEHGEEKCVSGDLYVCLDGALNVSERDPDCNGTGKGKACPIACVCMGTPLIDALGPIREFRDFTLKRGKLGRCFVSFYYSQVGPFLSLGLIRSETLRKGGRWVVRRILRRLEK